MKHNFCYFFLFLIVLIIFVTILSKAGQKDQNFEVQKTKQQRVWLYFDNNRKILWPKIFLVIFILTNINLHSSLCTWNRVLQSELLTELSSRFSSRDKFSRVETCSEGSDITKIFPKFKFRLVPTRFDSFRP